MMAQTQMNIRIDSNDKRDFERFCNEVGMNTTTAITLYIKSVIRTNKLPFQIEGDPFYSKENMDRLERAASDAASGQHMSEHELVEADE